MDEIDDVSEGASGRRRYWAVMEKRQIVEQTLSSPLRFEAANAAEEVLVLLVLIKVRFLSPPYSNCPGSTCLTHLMAPPEAPPGGPIRTALSRDTPTHNSLPRLQCSAGASIALTYL